MRNNYDELLTPLLNPGEEKLDLIQRILNKGGYKLLAQTFNLTNRKAYNLYYYYKYKSDSHRLIVTEQIIKERPVYYPDGLNKFYEDNGISAQSLIMADAERPLNA